MLKGIYASRVENGKVIREIVVVDDRNCEVCGSKFSPKQLTSKYCSRKCSKKAEYKRNAKHHKEKSKQWYLNNIEKVMEKRKAIYQANPDYYKQQAAEWYRNNKEKALAWHKANKDKKRHGGLKQALIEENGKICSQCGKETDGKDLHAHHATFDSSDHDNQIIVCNSCHGKIHIKRRNPNPNVRV